MKDSYFKVEKLIELVHLQHPERNDVVEALHKIEIAEFPRQAYKYFVSGEKPNQTESEWQFKENLVLEGREDGTIILDILVDGRIGGVEIVKYIL